MSGYISAGKPKLEAIFRVSKRGKGLYLYLPEDVTIVLGLEQGYKVRATIEEIFRPKTLSEIEVGKER